MNRILLIVLIILLLLTGSFYVLNKYIYKQKQGEPMTTTETVDASQATIHITPISHATMVLHTGDQAIYTDPVGGAGAFAGQPPPGIILVTDIHGDHFDAETLSAITKTDTIIVAPQAVADMLPENLPGTVVVIANGEKTTQKGVGIEAVPMYNMPESTDAPHTKGRGNGYIVTVGEERVYIAGDTAVTPEMRALQDIDVAFVPMNMPYTMTVEQAAEGVLAFKPKVVHPYHYREQNGLADVNKFKEIVEAGNPNITVDLLDFYPAY